MPIQYMRQILLRGLPGSGKSTLAKLLQDKCGGIEYLSSGSLLRAFHANEATEASQGINRGELAESDLVIRLMHGAYSRIANDSKIILIDGFPRKVTELDRWIKLTGTPDFAIYCTCDENVRVKKLLGRRVCKSCGAVYNMYEDAQIQAIKPRITGRCDHCHGTLISRPDDTPTAIATRTIIHEETDAPVGLMLEHMLKPDHIVRVDMTSELEKKAVTDSIRKLSWD